MADAKSIPAKRFLRKKKDKENVVRKEKFLINIRKHPALYIMALPVLIYFIIFHIVPMIGVIISFQRFVPSNGLFDSEWVAFDNFIRFFQYRFTPRLIRNTFLIQFYDLLVGFPAPIIFSLLLNEVQNTKFKKVTQTITYMPHFISLVVICGIIFTFSKEGGILSEFITNLTGRAPENLLSNARYFRPLYIGTNIWQGFGWGSIIYIAALSGIDVQLYEAAVIDGANRWKQVIYVTLPGIAPTIIIMLILRMGQMFSVGFEKIILLYSPIIYDTADVISTYMFRSGILEMNYSYSTAVGLFNSLINLVLILIANAISRKVTETSLW